MMNRRYNPYGLRVPNMLPLLMFWLLAACGIVAAHGGDDHGAAEPAPAGPNDAGLSTHGETGRVEMLMKYPAPEVGAPVRLRFFLADYATNRPLAGVRFVISSRPRGVTTQGPATMTSPGIYEVIATFPADTVYTFVTTLALGDSSEQIELRNIYAGKTAEQFLAEHGAPGAADEHSEDGGWGVPVVMIGAAILGLGALALALRNRGVRTAPRVITGSTGSAAGPATGSAPGAKEPLEPEREEKV